MLASVIICTYNRSDLLEESLLSVCRQDLADDQYEILVVDNNSIDNTRQVVQNVAASSKVKISYIFEKRQGLSFARNSGIDAAQGEIVVFTDDDIEAEPQWLRKTVAIFSSPEVACAGGPIRPLWPHEKPQWLDTEREGFLTISEFEAARETGRFSYPNYPWGANIAFRRTVFKEIGVFPTDLGRIGASLLSNEELNLCKRIEAAGYLISFAPEAVIHHKIPAQRMTKSWMMHRAYWQGRSDAILDTGTTPFRYSRLRDFARQLFWHQAKDRGADFTTTCIERNLIGYLHQLLIVSQEPPLSQFRKIRAIRKFLSSFTKLTGASFAGKRAVITGLEQDLAKRDQQAAQLEVWLADREKEIHDRDEWLAERDGQIVQYKQWLTDRERDIHERDRWLAERDAQIAQYQQWLTDRERDVQERDRWLAERDGQIAQYKQWLANRERDVQEHDRWLAERDGQIAQYKQWLADRERDVHNLIQQVADKESEIDHREQLLAECDRHLKEYEQLLDERDKGIADRDARLTAKRKVMTEHREAIVKRDAEIEDLRRKLDERDQTITGLLDTVSWKITAPLRWLSPVKRVEGSNKIKQ